MDRWIPEIKSAVLKLAKYEEPPSSLKVTRGDKAIDITQILLLRCNSIQGRLATVIHTRESSHQLD